MSEYLCLLVTIYYRAGGSLIECALKAKIADLPNLDYIMEPENLKALTALLPEHVRECGPIVKVEEIFEVHTAQGKT